MIGFRVFFGIGAGEYIISSFINIFLILINIEIFYDLIESRITLKNIIGNFENKYARIIFVMAFPFFIIPFIFIIFFIHDVK